MKVCFPHVRNLYLLLFPCLCWYDGKRGIQWQLRRAISKSSRQLTGNAKFRDRTFCKGTLRLLHRNYQAANILSNAKSCNVNIPHSSFFSVHDSAGATRLTHQVNRGGYRCTNTDAILSNEWKTKEFCHVTMPNIIGPLAKTNVVLNRTSLERKVRFVKTNISAPVCN